MSAAKQNFLIEQRATFKKRLQWRTKNNRPINLTGYSALMQVRVSAGDSTVLLELSTANGRITLQPAQGIFDLCLSATETASIAFVTGVYDLVVTAPDGTVIRLLEGRVSVAKGVSA